MVSLLIDDIIHWMLSNTNAQTTIEDGGMRGVRSLNGMLVSFLKWAQINL